MAFNVELAASLVAIPA